jgi:hypothetical protein
MKKTKHAVSQQEVSAEVERVLAKLSTATPDELKRLRKPHQRAGRKY